MRLRKYSQKQIEKGQLTVSDLALRSGYSTARVSRWLKSTRPFRLEFADAILVALNLQIENLLTAEELQRRTQDLIVN